MCTPVIVILLHYGSLHESTSFLKVLFIKKNHLKLYQKFHFEKNDSDINCKLCIQQCNAGT